MNNEYQVKQTNRLKELMKLNNVTQSKLAEKLGQSRINFNKIVNNKRQLDIPTAKKVAEIFDRQWFELYEDINVTVQIAGTINLSVTPYVKLNDPLETVKDEVIVISYLDRADNLIAIRDVAIGMIWLMSKDDKTEKIEVQGLNFVKDKDKYYFVRYEEGNGVSMIFDPGYSVEKKRSRLTIPKNKKFDWAIPVSRIDNWFKEVKQ